MARLYSNFIRIIYRKDGTSFGSEQFGMTCSREGCDRKISRGEPVWSVSVNKSDGWVVRQGEVHPECGEAMDFHGLTERIAMERAAVDRRNARRARQAARA